MATYVLTRFPDVDGKVNYSWKRKHERKWIGMPPLISWDWEWIRKQAEKLKVGESKEFEEDVP